MKSAVISLSEMGRKLSIIFYLKLHDSRCRHPSWPWKCHNIDCIFTSPARGSIKTDFQSQLRKAYLFLEVLEMMTLLDVALRTYLVNCHIGYISVNTNHFHSL
jgi:hypothetical protein